MVFTTGDTCLEGFWMRRRTILVPEQFIALNYGVFPCDHVQDDDRLHLVANVIVAGANVIYSKKSLNWLQLFRECRHNSKAHKGVLTFSLYQTPCTTGIDSD
ncbi:hypothetical protein GOP47_0001862 [Adiantum capillus-veneris]|uniref:Uncharacterized protein n=1 Tax=Adiantum capillus-veneris TaxID=13818 RepID=A0A9D4ZNN7_ADICA|nr:hypothetical protein GOP47_0001862 [Adiantum capillus-veneris]